MAISKKDFFKIIDIAQFERLKIALNDLVPGIKSIREEVILLNQELQKSNSYFERMDKSSRVTENLSKVTLLLTMVIIIFGAYPVLRDVGFEPVMSIILAGFFSVIVFYISIHLIFKTGI